MILPIFVLFLLGIAEFGAAFADHLALGQATREAVRSASLGSDMNTVLTRARNSSLGLSDRGTPFNVFISHSIDNGATYTAQTLLTITNPTVPNTIPSSALVRVRIIFHHQFITGSFFSFLPGVVGGNRLPIGQALVMRKE